MDQKKVQEDDDRVFQSESPLNMAASRGDSDLVKALTKEQAEAATEYRGRSALHMASAKGYTDIVCRLVPEDDPDMCTARDVDGRNPLHLAAIYGRVEVLELLVQRCPQAAEARADGGGTILHLCFKYNHKEALKSLLKIAKLEELVNHKDDNGNTLLHLAVAEKNKTDLDLQLVKRLLDCSSIDVNLKNSKGRTVLDIAIESGRKSRQKLEGSRTEVAETLIYLQIKTLVKQGAKRGGEPEYIEWLMGKSDALMVVASLMATIAFQAGVSPPGGVWQEDSADGHIAGEAVMAFNNPDTYAYCVRLNTLAFMGSLSIILMLQIRESPFMKKFLVWLLVAVMWLTVVAMSLSYVLAIRFVTPKKDGGLLHTIKAGFIIWASIMIVYSTVTILLSNATKSRELRLMLNKYE